MLKIEIDRIIKQIMKNDKWRTYICEANQLNQNTVRYQKYTFTTGSLPGGDAQNLGGDPHWALNPQRLVLGTTNQIGTNYE